MKAECPRARVPDTSQGTQLSESRSYYSPLRAPQYVLPVHCSCPFLQLVHGTKLCTGPRVEGNDNEGLLNFSDMLTTVILPGIISACFFLIKSKSTSEGSQDTSIRDKYSCFSFCGSPPSAPSVCNRAEAPAPLSVGLVRLCHAVPFKSTQSLLQGSPVQCKSTDWQHKLPRREDTRYCKSLGTALRIFHHHMHNPIQKFIKHHCKR